MGQVRTTKRWMNLAAPIARPLFKWNHDIVMQQGGKGLACLLKRPVAVLWWRHATSVRTK